MHKVIRKLTPENNIDFENICSFETDSYIGIWDQANDTYAIMKKSDFEFWLHQLPECTDLEDLDNKVYGLTNEHIIGVSEFSNYTFRIDEDD